MKPATVLILILVCALSAFAQTEISGPQSGVLGPGQYLVIGDISVNGRDTLTIMPGTEFLHNGHHYWNIYGLFLAQGEESDSISFVRQNPVENHRWGGLRFHPGASHECQVDYCIIDNAKIASGTSSSVKGGGIYAHGVDLEVTNTRISNCDAYWHGGGIYAENAAILVNNCVVTDNEATLGANGGGIYLDDCVNAQILNSIIARNKATGT